MDDTGLYSLQVDGAGLKLRPGFKLGEFASRCGCDQVLVHPWLLDGLEALRSEFGKVVRINSAYRTVRHNKAVGGRQTGENRSGGSKHLYGLAADVDVLTVSPDAVASWAEAMGFGGVGRYNTFTHIDVWGINRRWDNR